MDLAVWYDDHDAILGFELCYDKGQNERAMKAGGGFPAQRIDDGERGVCDHKEMTLLVPDGVFPAEKIFRLFKDDSRNIDQRITDFIFRMLEEYPP